MRPTKINTTLRCHVRYYAINGAKSQYEKNSGATIPLIFLRPRWFG